MDASQYLSYVDENGEIKNIAAKDVTNTIKVDKEYLKNSTAVVAKVSVDNDALILDGVRADGLQIRIPKRDLIIALSKLM